MELPKPEEINEVDEIIASSAKETVIQKIKHILSVVTIEPVIFLHFLAFASILMTQNQMIVYKTCRGRCLFMT